jgi:hypothetical protein
MLSLRSPAHIKPGKPSFLKVVAAEKGEIFQDFECPDLHIPVGLNFPEKHSSTHSSLFFKTRGFACFLFRDVSIDLAIANVYRLSK